MCRLAGWRSVVPVRMRRQRVTSLNEIHFRSVGWLRTYCFRFKPNIWLSSWVKREPNVRMQHFCYRDQQLFRFRRFVSQFNDEDAAGNFDPVRPRVSRVSLGHWTDK